METLHNTTAAKNYYYEFPLIPIMEIMYPNNVTRVGNVIRMRLDFPLDEGEGELGTLAEYLYIMTNNSNGARSALVETAMPLLTYREHAYEIRQQVVGNLSTGKVKQINPVLAKLGGSKGFGTLTHLAQPDLASWLPADHMFEPLQEMTELTAPEIQAFLDELDCKMIEAFQLYSLVLGAINHKMVRRWSTVQFDTGIVRDEQGGIAPALIETHVSVGLNEVMPS